MINMKRQSEISYTCYLNLGISGVYFWLSSYPYSEVLRACFLVLGGFAIGSAISNITADLVIARWRILYINAATLNSQFIEAIKAARNKP